MSVADVYEALGEHIDALTKARAALEVFLPSSSPEPAAAIATTTTRPSWTPQRRAKQRELMKKYWAKRKSSAK
jgi:hypothetical protein